jgi:hypothetical protein
MWYVTLVLEFYSEKNNMSAITWDERFIILRGKYKWKITF